MSVDEARDVLWTCNSAELYEFLVMRGGRSPDGALRRVIAGAMGAVLLP